MTDTPPADPGPLAPGDWQPPDLDPDLADAARADYAERLDEVAALDPDQLDYLARVDELPDPLTDGLACGEYDDTGI